MKMLFSCVKKDMIEIIRSKKNLLLLLLLICCMLMVLITTKFMPTLIQTAMNVSNILSDDTSLVELMNKCFPTNLKGSIGAFSSNIGVFYSLLVIYMTFDLLPKEIESGKLILPVCAGYNKNTFFFSKQIVYGFFCAFPVFPIYMIYYFIGSTFLSINIEFKYVVVNALVLMTIEMLISTITIALSVIYRHKYLPLINMASIVIIFPDFLSLFSW